MFKVNKNKVKIILKSLKIFLSEDLSFWSSEYIATSRFIYSARIGIRPYSHFPDTCGSKTSFVVDRLRVHTAVMLSATQIVSEYFLQSVNSVKRNKEARKVKFFQQKYYFLSSPIKIIFFSAILVIFNIDATYFSCSWHCLFLDYFNWSAALIVLFWSQCGQIILEILSIVWTGHYETYPQSVNIVLLRYLKIFEDLC